MSFEFTMEPRSGGCPALSCKSIESVVLKALSDGRLVGAVVLVAKDGEMMFRHAAGYADRERGWPMTVDTVFRLASVSKPIVSAAALVLAARGRIGLDERIDRWLPEFRPRLIDGREPGITVRQLLSHTAGLGYRFLEADETAPYAQAGVSDGMDGVSFDLAENLRRIASVPLLYAPGTGWGYSVATDVLGAVIERAHGAPLGVAVRDLVTGPLGMVDTDFVARDARRLATPYVNDGQLPHRLREGETVPVFDGTVGIRYSPARILNPRAFPSGGAGMAGTAPDVLRLLEALRQRDGGLLPAELATDMARDHTDGQQLPGAPGFGFGLGFSVLRDPVLAASPESVGTWRWGGAYGHAWFVDPVRRLTVVALTNTLYEGMTGQFVNALRDAVYGAFGSA